MVRVIERHPMGSFELWKRKYETWWSILSTATTTRPPKSLEALGSLISNATRCAAVCSLRPEDTDKMCEALRVGAQGCAAAFAGSAHDAGHIEARLGSQVVTIVASGAGASTVHFGKWLFGLGAALIVRDQVATDILCKTDSIEVAGASVTASDSFWPPFAHALACLVRADPLGWREYAGEARELIKLSPSDPTLHSVLLDVGDALMNGEKERWSDAVASALNAHRDYWSVGDRAGYDDGLLDVPLAGICALARDRGMDTEVESGYMPRALVTGGCSGQPSEIVYVFPRARARTHEEMHLSMTLQGCTESPREHRVMASDSALVAVYECEPREGGERLRFEFEMPENASTGEEHSTLIDAGQYLLLADEMAKTVAASPRDLPQAKRAEGRASLTFAINYLREVLKFIPPSQSKAPESAFWTSAGKEMFRREPGRFDRRRLEAVLGAWGTLLEKYGDGLS